MQSQPHATLPPAPLAGSMDRALQHLAELSGSEAIRSLFGNELLMERAWLTGARFSSGRSTSGATRLLHSLNGVIAITLARPDDWALLPAWLEVDDFDLSTDSEQAWQDLADRVRRRESERLIDQGRTLGLPVAATGAHRERLTPDFSHLFERDPLNSQAINLRANQRPPRVIDLSALWAGPLCSHLLHLCGAEVIKLESIRRPDGARAGHSGFYGLLNQGKRSVAVDLGAPDGIRALRTLIESADILIESSRPRALRQLGIVAEEILETHPALVWISLTGYGRAEPRANWIAFGDDAGVAAGLADLMQSATGAHQLAGDAIADPLTGTHAALAAWQACTAGRGGMIELALADIAAWCLRSTLAQSDEQRLLADCRRWWAAVQDAAPPSGYQGRGIREPVAELGADTERVLAKASRPC